MKAVTILQPSASLLALGISRYEPRHWRTWYRGPLALHAGLHFPLRGRKVFVRAEPIAQPLKRAGYVLAADLPVRAFVGVATLKDCLLLDAAARERLAEEDPTLPYRWGRTLDPDRGSHNTEWVWVFTDAVPLAAPVAYPGAGGRVFDVPDDLFQRPPQPLAPPPDYVRGAHNQEVDEAY